MPPETIPIPEQQEDKPKKKKKTPSTWRLPHETPMV